VTSSFRTALNMEDEGTVTILNTENYLEVDTV